MRKILLLLCLAIVLMAGVALVRTLRYDSPQPTQAPALPVAISSGAPERLAGSLRIPTVSDEDNGSLDAAAFDALHAYLEAQFSQAHSQLQRETVATHSLLYTWPGTEPSLKPILLAGHLDIVPVEAGTEDDWQEQPFAGRIADGFIWGRGAIDNKFSVLGTLEAVEMLLTEGFRPRRTVYLAYGHDEEIGGTHGAREIAAVLRRRGVELEMVVDEGGVLASGMVPGIAAPVALVGIAEKGFVSVELETLAPGGHSSLPPPQSPVGILGAAVARLEAQQMPARLGEATRQLLERIGTAMTLSQRVALANLWLTEPLVVRRLEQAPSTNAMVRTTTAVTIFRSGTKDNVLASRAQAVVNFRIAPGDSIADVLRHIDRVVDDSRVEANVVGAFSSEPSGISSTDSVGFTMLERTILSIVPDAIVAPYLVVVVTDARHYEALSDSVFRFQPLQLAPEDIERMHGTNERVAIADYERAIRFYRELILNAAK